jgi:hypothetical protein
MCPKCRPLDLWKGLIELARKQPSGISADFGNLWAAHLSLLDVPEPPKVSRETGDSMFRRAFGLVRLR